MKIYIQENNIKFDIKTKTFSVKGKEVKFATSYEVVNEKTGHFSTFDFVESTGSEWDVNTKWIYKNENGYILEVGNEDVTQTQINSYLTAKMLNS